MTGGEAAGTTPLTTGDIQLLRQMIHERRAFMFDAPPEGLIAHNLIHRVGPDGDLYVYSLDAEDWLYEHDMHEAGGLVKSPDSSPADGQQQRDIVAETSDDFLGEIMAHVARYNGKWFDRDEAYWFQRLVQEVGELGSVIAGDHDDTMEHELTQIASIAINWRRMRAEQQAGLIK